MNDGKYANEQWKKSSDDMRKWRHMINQVNKRLVYCRWDGFKNGTPIYHDRFYEQCNDFVYDFDIKNKTITKRTTDNYIIGLKKWKSQIKNVNNSIVHNRWERFKCKPMYSKDYPRPNNVFYEFYKGPYYIDTGYGFYHYRSDIKTDETGLAELYILHCEHELNNQHRQKYFYERMHIVSKDKRV